MEAIQFRQPLFESQMKDFKTIVKNEIESLEYRHALELFNSYIDFLEASNDERSEEISVSDLFDADFFVNVVKEAVNHPLAVYDLGNIMRAPKNTPDDNSRIKSYALAVSGIFDSLADAVSDPTRQDPDYELFDRGDGYSVYHIKNYAAARSFCNSYNATHCIGSSETNWFPEYEKKYNGDTFAITTQSELVYVHAGENGFLITSTDNTSEVNDDGAERGGGLNKIVDDLRAAGLSIDDVKKALKTAVGFDYEEEIDQMFVYIEEEENSTGEVVYDGSETRIIVRNKDGNNVIRFQRPRDGISADVIDGGQEYVRVSLMGGTFSKVRVEQLHSLLYKYFGIKGYNVDRISQEAKLKMRDIGHQRLMTKIAEDFL